jgi:hypothetical protein
MSSDRTISKNQAARLAGVSKQSIFVWIHAGRVQVDDQGRVLRDPFERDHCNHIIITRLRETMASIPLRHLVPILIEELGAEFIQSLVTVAKSSLRDEGSERGHAR